jgi:hypothetical protein
MYIKENFIPHTDQKMKEKLITNLEKVHQSEQNLLKIKEKQEQNKFKGRQFLEESTKIGREIKEKFGLNSMRYIDHNNSKENNKNYQMESTMNNFYETSEQFSNKKKRRKKFKYHFKKGAKFESSYEESERSQGLVIGPTEDFDGWEEEEIEERAEEFLNELKEKDRLIMADDGSRFNCQRFRTDRGTEYTNKVDFVVDTIRDKLNFIKNFT